MTLPNQPGFTRIGVTTRLNSLSARSSAAPATRPRWWLINSVAVSSATWASSSVKPSSASGRR